MNDGKRYGFFIGMIILFGGFSLAILLSHLSRAFGFLLIAIGLVIMYLTRDTATSLFGTRKRIDGDGDEKEYKNLGQRFIDLITLDGRLKPFFPILGIILLAGIMAFNILIADEFSLGSNDYVALLLAGALIAYNYIPKKYNVERDFALIFMIFLFMILVVPTTIYSVAYSSEPDTNSRITYYLLVLPTAGLLKMIGVDVAYGHSLTLFQFSYMHMEVIGPGGQVIPVSIGLSCTGLYSVSIFVSAFIAFIFVEYNKIDRKVLTMLSIGIFLAWLANVIRMAIIILVGKYYGWDAMEWTHNNIGEVIFMIWVSIFWLIMFKYLGIWKAEDEKQEKKDRSKIPVTDRSGKATGRADPGAVNSTSAVTPPPRRKCDLCDETLSHTIPAYRCNCGKIYHLECTSSIKNCPACHRMIDNH